MKTVDCYRLTSELSTTEDKTQHDVNVVKKCSTAFEIVHMCYLHVDANNAWPFHTFTAL